MRRPDGGKVLRGGGQLAALDACNTLRLDRHTSELDGIAARATA